MTIKGKTIGFVGAGNMGEAMIKGLLAANLVPPESICASASRSSTGSTGSRSPPTTRSSSVTSTSSSWR